MSPLSPPLFSCTGATPFVDLCSPLGTDAYLSGGGLDAPDLIAAGSHHSMNNDPACPLVLSSATARAGFAPKSRKDANQ